MNCKGFQHPRTGKGFAGFVVFDTIKPYEREYISAKLDFKLNFNESYCVSFYVSLSNYHFITNGYMGSRYAIDRIGLYFSDNEIQLNTYDIIPVIPQISNTPGNILKDTINWMLISGTFLAQGGEQYITIGNFYQNDSTNYSDIGDTTNLSFGSYYYIDDVSVYECDAPVYIADAGNNITICKGDSVQIGTVPRDQYLYNWQPTAGLSDTTCANPYTSPTQTTTYYLYQKDFKFDETVDSVTVTVMNCNDTINYFHINPTLTNDLIYIEYSSIYLNNNFGLYDVCGQLVKDIIIENPSGKQTISTSGIASGLYLYRLASGKDILFSGKIVKVN